MIAGQSWTYPQFAEVKGETLLTYRMGVAHERATADRPVQQ